MFAYFTKMNGTNIITYTHDMARLYFDEDDCDSGSGDGSGGGDEYLFNNQTISSDIASGTSGYEEMPPPFSTQPPLLFSYC